MKKINDRISLRKIELPAEEALWREIFYDPVREHFAALKLPENDLNNLLEMQFQAQNLDYQKNYPQSANDVIVFDGAPAGRVIASTEHGDVHIIEIAVSTPFRNLGIGTEILRHFFDLSRRTRLPIRFYVEKGNRARRLYEKLGFVIVADLVSHYQMEWKLDL